MSANQYIDQDTVDRIKQEEEGAAKKSRRKKSKKKDAKKGNGRLMVSIMNGEFMSKDWFVRNLPFTFYVAFLMVVMIGWGYYGETMAKKEVQLQEELSELNSEYSTLSSDYIKKKGRKQVEDQLAGTGLVESRISPKKIRVKKYVFK